MTYFYDTYALIQIALSGEQYKTYQQGVFILHFLNLYEFYHVLCKQGHKESADSFLERLQECCVEATIEDVKIASHHKLHSKELSYADALGYTIARRRGLKFLTGDDAFKNLEGVEFLK